MKVLFLCVANSARSQMAEGFARAMFEGLVRIESAGSKPSGVVHPMAILVMRECGIDLSRQYSKGWNELPDDFLSELDFVITLCDEECPNFRTKAKRLNWGIKDPASATGAGPVTTQAFREARDKIRSMVENFGAEYSLL